jgi:hypothetical protein
VPLITIRMLVAAAVVVAAAGGLVVAGFWVAGNVRVSAGSAGPVLAAAGAGVAGVLVYARSLQRRPWRRCLRCKGSGRNVDTTLFTGQMLKFLTLGAVNLGPVQGRCTCCDGRQVHVRPGVRVFQPGRARELKAGKRGRYG